MILTSTWSHNWSERYQNSSTQSPFSSRRKHNSSMKTCVWTRNAKHCSKFQSYHAHICAPCLLTMFADAINDVMVYLLSGPYLLTVEVLPAQLHQVLLCQLRVTVLRIENLLFWMSLVKILIMTSTQSITHWSDHGRRKTGRRTCHQVHQPILDPLGKSEEPHAWHEASM